MPKQVQLRRGTTAEHATFTGVIGEVTVDTTKDTAVIHDGTQVGGYPLARESALANYQPLDADLTAIGGLSGTSGLLKKTDTNTWSLDTSTYLVANQTITFSGDATGSGTTAVTLTLANSGVSANTYRSVTVDVKGRVTAGSNPTTLSGYGITDAAPLASPTFTGTATFATTDALGPVRGNITAVAALDIDCSAGNFFTKTINANSTFTFSNVPASRAFAFTLELTHTSGTVTWPTTVRWPGGTAPTLTTSRVHLFTFVTDDGGTNWRAASQTNYTA